MAVATIVLMSPVVGQDEVDPKIGTQPATPDTRTDEASPNPMPPAAPLDSKPMKPSPGTVLLPDAEGNPVAVPKDARLEDYLEFLRRKRADAERRAGVVRLNIEGTADAKVATLRVTLQVKVTDDGWVRVPLALNEGVLVDYSHRFLVPDGAEGEGEDTQKAPEGVDEDFDGHTTDEGYAWRFLGRGVHELVLDLQATVRLQSPARRLQLTLPETAVGTLALTVDHGTITVTAPQGSQSYVDSAGMDRSTIHVVGLGQRFTLGWEPRPAPRAAGLSLQSTTAIDVRPNDRTIVLEATQFVNVLRGSTESIRIRLPTGFEARDVAMRVGDDTTRGDLVRLDLPEQQGVWTTIDLPEAVSERGRIELDWTLESTSAWSDGPLQIEGFEVSNCRTQSGEIAIHGLAGHDVGVGTTRNVHRVDVAELTRSTGAVVGHRFLRQPFRMAIRVTEVEPHFTTRPDLALHATRDDLRLTGEVYVKVYRGALRQVELSWPNHVEEGWVLSPPNVPGLVEQHEILGEGEETRIRFQLLNPTTGEFTLPVRALRRIEASPEPMPLHLPSMPASYQLPSLLRMTRTVDVEVALDPTDATTTHEAARTGDVADAPEDAVPVETVRIDPGGFAFGLTVERRDPSTTVENTIRVTMPDSTLRVVQELEFETQYGYTRRLRFVAAEGTRFSLAGEPLESRPVEMMDGPPLVEVDLDRPRTGAFVVLAESDHPVGDLGNGETKRTLSFCRPIGTDALRRRLVIADTGGYDVSATGPNWVPASSVDGEPVWTASAEATDVPLRIERVERRGTNRATIRRALLRAIVGGDGRTRFWSRFDVAEATTPLIVVLPEGTRVDEFRWNGRRLSGRDATETPRGSNRYTLDVGRESEGDGLLLVRFHSEEVTRLGWSGVVDLPAPQLPGTTWIEEAIWQLAVPDDQYLFLAPDRVAANYDWQPDPVFWRRVTRHGYEEPTRWIEDRPSRDETLAMNGRNTYQFLAFGPVDRVSVRTTSRSCLVLFGAGLALALGFVVLRVPALRNVLVVLGLLFVLAVVSLWFLEPVLLLLQPALLGLALAFAAALIDRAVNRRSPAPPVLTFPSISVSGSGTGRRTPAGEASTRTNVGLPSAAESHASGSSLPMAGDAS